VEIGGKKYIYDGHILHEMSGERWDSIVTFNGLTIKWPYLLWGKDRVCWELEEWLNEALKLNNLGKLTQTQVLIENWEIIHDFGTENVAKFLKRANQFICGDTNNRKFVTLKEWQVNIENITLPDWLQVYSDWVAFEDKKRGFFYLKMEENSYKPLLDEKWRYTLDSCIDGVTWFVVGNEVIFVDNETWENLNAWEFDKYYNHFLLRLCDEKTWTPMLVKKVAGWREQCFLVHCFLWDEYYVLIEGDLTIRSWAAIGKEEIKLFWQEGVLRWVLGNESRSNH
jgi:hypothetical protein